MADARLRTVERSCSALHRHGDVDGWEIPGRYLGFLRGGPAEPLVDGRPPQRRGRPLAGPAARPARRRLRATGGPRAGPRRPATSPGLARAFARAGRLDEALACLTRPWTAERGPATPVRRHAAASPSARRARRVARARERVPWWSPRRAGRTSAGRPTRRPRRSASSTGRARLALDDRTDRRSSGPPAPPARPLRRGGRDAWLDLARGPRARRAIEAWIEVAKLREHRLRDPPARSTRRARPGPRGATPARSGWPDPRLEARPARPARAPPPADRRRGPRSSAGRRRRPAAPAGRAPRRPSARGPSRASGSNEQAIVRRSPASALR